MTTSSPLPPLYAEWMENLFKGPIPNEPHATCSDCAMCSKSPDLPELHGRFFSPSTKCCTFLPRLPNFLVGRILHDDDPALAVGRKSVLDRIARRVAVSPLGLFPSGPFSALYQLGRRESFGQSKALLCPHYVDQGGGSCGIWKYREAVCATYFCKHERGAVGGRFWIALRDLLSLAEQQLSWHCALQLGVGDRPLAAMFESDQRTGQRFKPGELDGQVRPADYRRTWGQWEGKEPDFYQRCAEKVDGMDWETVLSIGGPKIQARMKLAESAFKELRSHRIADRLKMGAYQVVSGRAEGTRVSTYSRNNPLEVPNELLRVLPSFDGRPLDQVLSDVAQQGFELDTRLIRRLMDFQLLLPSEHEEPATEDPGGG